MSETATPSVRRALKQAAGAAARFAPRGDIATRRVILCYHSVHPSVPYASASPAQFAEHLDWLASHCDVVPLDALVEGPNDTGRPRVAITFDDGYADNYRYAFLPLTVRDLPATFFVTVGFLERAPEVLTHLSNIWRTPRDELDPLTWSQVDEMRAGGMAFGSHTWSHANLATVGERRAASELVRSKEVLESRTATSVSGIAYPFGKLRHHVSGQTFRLAATAGYRYGFISLPRAISTRDDRYRIPRFGVGDDGVEALAAKVRGEIDWHASVHQHLPRRLSATLFTQYP
jgi:peptidoglycan/xylan/chitin deacetylase (PgdA/CDA1 family)